MLTTTTNCLFEDNLRPLQLPHAPSAPCVADSIPSKPQYRIHPPAKMHLLLRTLPIRSSLSSCPISRSIQGTTNTSIANLFPSYSLRSMHTHIPHSHTRTAYARSRNNSRPLAVALGLGSLPFLAPGRPTWLDASSAFGTDSDAFSSSAANGKNVPIIKDGKLNQAAVQQISFGAVLGLGLGVLFSMFSRMLVLLLGLGIVVWQVSHIDQSFAEVPFERTVAISQNMTTGLLTRT